jgi:hypothetical protein
MALTILQTANAWIAAGGPRSRAVEFVAIAMGESSLNPDAVSPAGAQGTWQIMPFWWAQLGLPADRWNDPVINARAAVAISGHGTNCAAWDSAYANIYASGRYSFLGWPEHGSADYGHLQYVATVLGHDRLGGAVPPSSPMPSKSINHAESVIQQIIGRVYPAIDREIIAWRMAYQAAYRKP